MKRRELLVKPGGLMRCCTQSIADWIIENPEAEVAEGEILSCRYERTDPDAGLVAAKMIVNGDTVSWYDPDYPPLTPKKRPA